MQCDWEEMKLWYKVSIGDTVQTQLTSFDDQDQSHEKVVMKSTHSIQLIVKKDTKDYCEQSEILWVVTNILECHHTGDPNALILSSIQSEWWVSC